MKLFSRRSLGRELKKGSAELLILSLLEPRARHGYQISKLIDERSGGRIRFKVASLYPLLYRLQERSSMNGTRRSVERARAKPAHAPPRSTSSITTIYCTTACGR